MLASFQGIEENSASITFKQGPISGTAQLDPPNHSAAATAGGKVGGVTVKVSVIYIAPDAWVQLGDFGPLNARYGLRPNKWMKLDRKKVDPNTLPLDFQQGDNLDLRTLFSQVGDVQRVDATHYSGTIDLNQATGVSAPSDDDLKKIGAKASAVPFTATLDDKGRLTQLDIDTGDPDTSSHFTVSGYGTPQAIKAPDAAQVVPTPQSLYAFLNG
jgi:hypothetical protein